MMTYTLIDAVERNRLHPNTFHIPSTEEIMQLKKNDYAKVGFEEEGKLSEKMWVEINRIDGGKFEGKLNNDPFNLETIKDGDAVHFESKHILAIYSDIAD